MHDPKEEEIIEPNISLYIHTRPPHPFRVGQHMHIPLPHAKKHQAMQSSNKK